MTHIKMLSSEVMRFSLLRLSFFRQDFLKSDVLRRLLASRAFERGVERAKSSIFRQVGDFLNAQGPSSKVCPTTLALITPAQVEFRKRAMAHFEARSMGKKVV